MGVNQEDACPLANKGVYRIAIPAIMNPSVCAPESPRKNFAGGLFHGYKPILTPKSKIDNLVSAGCFDTKVAITKNANVIVLTPTVNPSMLSIKLKAFVIPMNHMIVISIFRVVLIHFAWKVINPGLSKIFTSTLKYMAITTARS